MGGYPTPFDMDQSGARRADHDGLYRLVVSDFLDSDMNKVLKSGFPPFLNEQSLRSAIESVCGKFGRVKSLKILPATRGLNLHCACFLRLDSAAAETALRSKLHVLKFAGDLYFFADVGDSYLNEIALIGIKSLD